MKNRENFFVIVYSKSFYLCFEKETKKVKEETYKSALILREIFIKNKNELFFQVLKNEKKTESKKIINDLFNDFLDKRWINLFSIMIDDEKIYLFILVLKKIILYFEDVLNIKHGEIFSVIKLEEKYILNIEKKISKFLNKDVKLSNYLDNKLIGGILVKVGEYKWDNSIKNKLDNLEKELLKN